jgi:hypothetical protein
LSPLHGSPHHVKRLITAEHADDAEKYFELTARIIFFHPSACSAYSAVSSYGFFPWPWTLHLIKRYDMMYSIHHIIKIVKRLITAEHADDAEKGF